MRDTPNAVTMLEVREKRRKGVGQGRGELGLGKNLAELFLIFLLLQCFFVSRLDRPQTAQLASSNSRAQVQ